MSVYGCSWVLMGDCEFLNVYGYLWVFEGIIFKH